MKSILIVSEIIIYSMTQEESRSQLKNETKTKAQTTETNKPRV